MNKVIIITGPTASGKSSIAVDLAKHLDTEIISCDSMQIYKNMNIGTAKVTEDEMQGIKHHLIDIVEPNATFSVSEWSNLAKEQIDRLHNENKIPIIVGGTGLYIDSLVYNLSFFCNEDKELREKLNNMYAEYGNEYLYKQLQTLDPIEATKIHPNNTKRLIRALEIYYSSGKLKSEYNERQLNTKYEFLLLVISKDRNILYENINTRVDKMFDQGLLDEINYLLDNKLVNWNDQSMQAIGYKEFKPYFEGLCNLEKVKYDIKINSRHYAKRQISWFKRYQFAKFIEQSDIINDYIENFIKEGI